MLFLLCYYSLVFPGSRDPGPIEACERDEVESWVIDPNDSRSNKYRSAVLCRACGDTGKSLDMQGQYRKCPICGGAKIDQVVIGGESGASFRPMEISWAEKIAADCKAAGVKVWMKQLSGNPPAKELKDFPESLRVREWTS